ncbi:MAG: sigma-70 family RNA polymerase sigma factor, partial [Candidatus Omnitrophica bacterium]|nr:sigma-70 family RNA polymerase sigma factor [Candidatus Omnitrophota bacterium]
YWIKKKILEAIRKEKIQSLDFVELNEEILESPIVERTCEREGLDIFPDKNLTPLEQKIFKLHLQQEKSLSQIAKELEIRREKVRQTKQLLLRKIKINQKLTEDLYVVNRLSV